MTRIEIANLSTFRPTLPYRKSYYGFSNACVDICMGSDVGKYYKYRKKYTNSLIVLKNRNGRWKGVCTAVALPTP